MKIEINKIYAAIAVFMIVFYSSFAGYLGVKVDATLLYVWYAAAVLFAFISNISELKYRYVKGFPADLIVWIAFSLFVLVSYKMNMMGSTRIFFGIMLCVALKNRTSWIKPALKIIALLTGASVFFTLFFFIFPQFYTFVIDAYGFVPTGTSVGKAGYRAGISDHYSQNGIYISIAILLFAAIFITINSCKEGNGLKEKRINKFVIVNFVISFIALLLTGKRGVLVFSLISIISVYLIISKKKVDRAMKIAIFLLIAVGLLQILSETVPAIGYVFERFQSLGEDDSTLERLAMWDLAIKKFKEAPLLGNGLWSYRFFYKQELGAYFHPYEEKYQYLNAHNVYLQLLCETGIIGFGLYMASISLTLYKTIKNAKRIMLLDEYYLRYAVIFSLVFQLFYIIYSFTGNCLYDVVFPFYAIAIAMNMSVDGYLRTYGIADDEYLRI